MIRRIAIAFIVEWHKALFNRMTWLAPLFILLVACAMPVLHPFMADGESDYDFVLFSVSILNSNLLMLFVLIYSANLIAPEISSGLARHVLVRPIRRYEWYFAKLCFALSYALLLSILTAAMPWGTAFMFGDLNGVNYGGELIHTTETMQNAFLLGVVLSIPPIWAGAAFALLLSTASRSALSAAGLAIALWIVLDIAKYPLGIEEWVYSTWLEGAWQPMGNMLNVLPFAWQPVVRQSLLSSAILFFPSIVLGIVLLQRRNITK